MKKSINIKAAIGILVLGIVAAVVTVLLLSKFAPRQDTPDATAKVVAPSSSEIIKKVQETESVGELSTSYIKRETPLAGLDDISYTKEGSFMVSQVADDSVQFELSDTTVAENSASIKSNIEAFFVRNNLKKVTNLTAVTTLFTIFDSEQTTCQLLDLPAMGDNGAILSIACAKKASINDQYATIDKLLTLYDGPKSDIANPASIRLKTIKEDDKTVSMADIYGLGANGGGVSLFFAAIGSTWEYIGQLPLSTGDTAENPAVIDRSLPSDMQAKVNDQKYGNFLKEHVR